METDWEVAEEKLQGLSDWLNHKSHNWFRNDQWKAFTVTITPPPPDWKYQTPLSSAKQENKSRSSIKILYELGYRSRK